ncbi:hypothetical protein tb265_00480 [Gemmatimonadetes bacterium T265]|nr:hypothetical protein tb265_00480 [Gemmatimonadetes bacterium T265]
MLAPPMFRLLAARVRRSRPLARFAAADDGATMAEYALLVAVIALVALAGAKTLGTNLSTKFGNEAARVAAP